MSYLVLARKYRPQAFDDVTGQEHVVQTLANAIAHDRVAHAFLLCGPRGVGKTTTARLLARALNCAEGPTATPCGVCMPCKEIVAGSSIDVVEIDGASNNGVDNVRELREAARYLPQRDRHKVFIIDEVHMLSVAAFNALLKTLEEPPPHVKFVFATTDPQKLPDTILSRCQRHNFRRVPAGKMVERLRFVCGEEGIEISDRALALVAKQADGGMRDALSLLDSLLSSAGTQIDDLAVEEALGLVDRTVVHALAGCLLDRDGKRLIETLAQVYDRGVDARRLCEELAQHLRDLVYVKAIGKAPEDRGDVEQRLLVEQAGKADVAQITRLFDLVHHAIRDLSHAAQPRLALEVALLSAVHLAPGQGLADLAARLEAVAAALGAGAPAGAGAGGPVSAGPVGAMPRPPAPAGGMPPRPAPQGMPPAAMPQQNPGRPAPPQRPTQLPTSDLLQQVEALTRGRAAPRQAGGRGPGRGTPPADGSDEEPHGGHGLPERSGSASGSPPSPRPMAPPAAPPQRQPPGGSRIPFEVPAGLPTPRGMARGGAAAPPRQSAPRTPPGRPVPDAPPPASRPGRTEFGRGGDGPNRSSARRAAAEAPPAWDDDEPPPPGDHDAPTWADDEGQAWGDDFSQSEIRPLPAEAMPGGCATNECRDDEPAASRGPASGRMIPPPAAASQRLTPGPGSTPAGRPMPPFAPAPQQTTPGPGSMPAARPMPAFAPAPQQTTPAPGSTPAARPMPPFAPAPPKPTAPAARPAFGTPLPAAAAQDAGGDDPTAAVHERWRVAVDGMRRENPIIGSCLSEGRLLWLRPGEVALGYAPANHFHRTQLESTFARQVEEMLTRWFNAPTRLRLQEAAADAPASVAEDQRRSREERRVRLRAEAREHPAVLAVQSILGGEIDDIEVLEER